MTLNYALTVKMLDYNTNADIVSEGGLVRAVDIIYYQAFIISHFLTAISDFTWFWRTIHGKTEQSDQWWTLTWQAPH